MAIRPTRRRRPHLIAVLVGDQFEPFEFGVVCEVFGRDRSYLADPWYRMAVCSADGRPPRSSAGGMVLDGVEGPDTIDRCDTLIVPPWELPYDGPPQHVIAAIRRANDRGARLVSICSGAYVLAHAGVLDGRRATTHWMHTEDLAARFPAVKVDPDVLYVDDGQVLTSAGTASGIDLCLHIVRLDHGAEAANGLARRMVVAPHRDGGQAQYVQAPVPMVADEQPLAATLDWALARLDHELSVEDLARQALMSPRTFARRFRDSTGTTPLQWLLGQRVLLAKRLLETTTSPVELVALQCGFGSATALRTHFKKLVGTSPLAYRRAFDQVAS
jgi:transcriptional regulator GlxA family with amidase domain